MRIRTTFIALILLSASFALTRPLSGQEALAQNNEPADRMSEARALLAEAKAAALKIEGDFQRGLALDEIGAAEAKAGDISAALDTADRAYPHTFATLTAIGKQLSDSDDRGQIQIRDAVQKLGAGTSTVYDFMAQRLAAKGKITEALQKAEQIQLPEIRRDALEAIARQQAASGDYAGARKTWAAAIAAYPAEKSEPGEDEIMIAEAQILRDEVEAAHATIISLKSAEARSAALIGGADELRKKGNIKTADKWLEEGLKGLPDGPGYAIFRYFALPVQVKLGQKKSAMPAAGRLSEDMRMKGYTAVAVACAEMKDVACVDSALGRVQAVAGSDPKNEDLSQFERQLMVLNVTAALIDNDMFAAATRLLAGVEQHTDDVSYRMAVEPEAQLQRVVILALQGRFDEARSLALKIRPDTVDEVRRGTALRTIALLQAKRSGASTPRQWASSITDAEGRAYALLGIAQAKLGIGDAKLSYSAIYIH